MKLTGNLVLVLVMTGAPRFSHAQDQSLSSLLQMATKSFKWAPSRHVVQNSFNFDLGKESNATYGDCKFLFTYNPRDSLIDIRIGKTSTGQYYGFEVTCRNDYVFISVNLVEDSLWGWENPTDEILISNTSLKKTLCFDPREDGLFLLDSVLRPLSKIIFDPENNIIRRKTYEVRGNEILVTEYLPLPLMRRDIYRSSFAAAVALLRPQESFVRQYSLKAWLVPFDLLWNLKAVRDEE
jgi:hypothetical protein